MTKIDKKILEEFSWEDDQEDLNLDQPADNPTAEAQKVLKTLDSLDNLDKTFDKFFKSVLYKNDDIKMFSSKVQRIELNNLSKAISLRREEKELSDFDEAQEIKKDLEKLFNNEGNDILKIFQNQNLQNNRKELYELYDEIADINYIAYRMLRVYIDNLLIKNVQNKDFLSIKENEINLKNTELEDSEKEFIKKYINMVLVYFNIQSKLKNEILPKMLKYGDFYVEIVNLSPIENIVKKQPQLLTENFTFNNRKFKNVSFAIYESTIRHKKISINNEIAENTQHLKGLKKFEYQLKKIKNQISKTRVIEEHDVSLFNKIMEPDFNIKQFFEIDLDVIDNLYLRLHEPSNVLKVNKDGVLYGYLIIENIDEKSEGETEINIYKRFLSDNQSDENFKKNVKDLADDISEEILRKMVEDIQDFDLDSFDESLKLSLKIIIYNKLLKKQKLKFRFIDPQDLINFHTIIDKYSPYGTSIFDSIVQPVKMYTIGLMTSIVSRLSRAAVIRKWNIEVGNRRNYQAIIEQVKKDLRDKSVTFESLTSIKNIAKIISDYKDIATITRDGQRFIDLEILPLHDRSLPIQELQDLRQELIAATGIPAVYLNMADTVDLRETLVNLNINFANQIITYQSFIEDALNDLINSITQKILELNGIDASEFLISQYFKITMNPPLVLQLQQNEALVGSVVNIIGALAQAQMPVDPLKLFEMYIPQVNWKQLKQSGDELIRDEMKKQLIQGQASNGGGF